MADTIVNTPAGNSDSGAAGWMVAIIVLIAVIGGGFVWYRYYRGPAPTGDTNINVTIPTPGAGTGDAGGGATQ